MAVLDQELAHYVTLATAQSVSGQKTFQSHLTAPTVETTSYSSGGASRTAVKIQTSVAGVYSRIGQFSTTANSVQMTFGNNLNRDGGGSIVKDNNSYASSLLVWGTDSSLSYQNWNLLGDTALNTACTIDASRNLLARNLYLGSSTQSTLTTATTYPVLKDIKGSSTLSNVCTLGVDTALGVYPLITLTSNTQSGYVCSAVPNNATAFRAFDNNIATSWSTNAFYNPTYDTGAVGAQFTNTINAFYVYGDYCQIQLPFPVIPFSYTYTMIGTGRYASQIALCGSRNNLEWYLLDENQTMYTSTVTKTIVYQYGAFQYFRFIIRRGDSTQGSPYSIPIYSLNLNAYFNTATQSYFPSSVEIGRSLYDSTEIDTESLLTVNGDLRVYGRVMPTAVGSVLNCQVYSTNTSLNNLPTIGSAITNTVNAVFAEISYYTKSSSSIITVEVDASYRSDLDTASGKDELYSAVAINNVNYASKLQQFNNSLGGGTRSSTIFPIHCAYKHVGTVNTLLDTEVRVWKVSDDNYTISYMTIKITEIAN